MSAENGQRKVLVVDDEPLVRQTLSMCLRDQCEVTTVSSGEEAIEVATRETFPVVILDLRMDGISGIETLKRLKKIRETQNVIILTAYESMESAIAALNNGAFNYLTKPFETARLRRIVADGFEVYEQLTLREEEMRQRLMTVHDSFFSMLCHEFNTPLNIILGFSELLAHSVEHPEHASWAKDIKDSGMHLHEILMEIVDYISAAHIAAAGIEKEFTLDRLLRPMVDAFQARNVAVEIEGDDALAQRLLGQPSSVFMIVRKLAGMASHQSNYVKLIFHLDPAGADGLSNLRVAVTQTGIHMNLMRRTDLDCLFEPYQFTTNDQSGLRTSLGLELATCKKIAEYADASAVCRFDSHGELELAAEIPVKVLEAAGTPALPL